MNSEITINNIAKARVAGLMRLGLLLVVALSTQAFSQTILIDDFNDGDFEGWTTIDFSLGQPWGPGTYDASSGAFHLQGKQDVLFGQRRDLNARWDQASNPIFANGYVRATFRVNEEANLTGIILRGSGCSDRDCTTGYGFLGTTAWNGIPGNGRFFFGRYVENGANIEIPLPSNLSFGVNEDWIIEAGAVGDQLSMKVWRVGEPEPESPQWTRTDRTLRTGDFGVVTTVHNGYHQPARVDGIIDDVYFRFPEHDDVYSVSPYNIYLWDSPMPVPQQEGPYFVSDSPEKPDMRGDVTKADGWPDLHLTGKVTDFDGKPIPGLKLDFWQTNNLGNYDNSGGYDLRGHIYTNEEGNYELWTVIPAAYETVRTRHLHLKVGGVNLGFQSPVFTTQLYFPTPYDNDIDADDTPDKVVQGGFETDFDAIPLEDDYITLGDLLTIGAEFSDLTGNILTINNDPVIDGYFDATLNIRMSDVFQALPKTPDRILIDNFNDGNADGWTTIDSTVGRSWASGPGRFDASSGAYHLEAAGIAPGTPGQRGFLASLWDQSSGPIFSDGFLRAKIRVETLGSMALLLFRTLSNPEMGGNVYQFGPTTAFNGFVFVKIVGGINVQVRRVPGNFSLRLNEWWNIEAGAVGNQLSMKVWRVGDPEPESPQLMFRDSNFLNAANIGVQTNVDNEFREPAQASATFDDIYFTFPEHDNVYAVSPYNIYLWESPMPVPQVEEPYFVVGSPNKTDMRRDITKAEGWPDLHLTGKVTDLDGQSIPGLRLDFWQVDDKGSYGNSGGYDLRGHLFTDKEGNYELWTIMPAAYDRFRTRNLHVKLGGLNLGFYSPVYTTQIYFPDPYDNDIDADGTPDKVIQDGVETDSDAIGLEEDSIALVGLVAVDAESSDLAGNTMTLNNEPAVDGYFDATVDIVMPQAFQAPDD